MGAPKNRAHTLKSLDNAVRPFRQTLTLGSRALPWRHMTIVLLGIAALVSLGFVAMCKASRDR
jgi:hypothetical protein